MRTRTAVTGLCALTFALAAPYALAGPKFILDDWFSLRNAMFDGAFAAGGHNQELARPGAWLVYGLTFGLIGNHPLPIFVLQTVVNAGVAVALFVVARRFLGAGAAFAAAAVWVVAPTHTSLDNWASALNISLALLALLVGVALLGHTAWNWGAAAAFAVSALCYEATMPMAAVAAVAAPLFARRRPRVGEDLALPAAALAACGAWILTHWHPDKHVGDWIDPRPIFAAHFGWGISPRGPLATVLAAGFLGLIAVAVVRLTFPSFRPDDVAPEATVAAGLVVMVIGLVPFLRYFYSPLGAGDRVNVVSSVGGALVVTGVGWMIRRLVSGATAAAALAAAVVVTATAAATNVHRDLLYARAGNDVLRTMDALDHALPHPDGPIALGPRPVITDNIGGLLDESNVDGALQVHRRRQGLRGYVTQDEAEWERAPAHLRFDQVRLLRGH